MSKLKLSVENERGGNVMEVIMSQEVAALRKDLDGVII